MLQRRALVGARGFPRGARLRQDGQRYATGVECARLAGRGARRAYVRMGERSNAIGEQPTESDFAVLRSQLDEAVRLYRERRSPPAAR